MEINTLNTQRSDKLGPLGVMVSSVVYLLPYSVRQGEKVTDSSVSLSLPPSLPPCCCARLTRLHGDGLFELEGHRSSVFLLIFNYPSVFMI